MVSISWGYKRIILWRKLMTKVNKKLNDEIQELREKLHDYIDKKGINDEPELRAINNRLDELIVQWVKELYH
jgi:hypothetical protein